MYPLDMKQMDHLTAFFFYATEKFYILKREAYKSGAVLSLLCFSWLWGPRDDFFATFWKPWPDCEREASGVDTYSKYK